MKFTAAALLAFVGFSDAKKMIDKSALLRNAVPVDKNGNRRLDQGQFEIDGTYSIQFNHCLSLKIAADNYEDYLFAESVIEYTKAGKVLAQASYVLFNVCKTADCQYQGDSNLYMVDLPTYLGAIVETKQQEAEDFCGACEESYDTCFAAEDAQQEEQDAGEGDAADGEEGEGGRRLQDNGATVYYENQGYKVVDCDTCTSKGCFNEDQQYDENNANYQITDEVIDEWLQNMLECADTGVVGPTGANLQAGFMCNEDGSGVQPAIFLDENCAVYTSMYSYANLVTGTNNYDIMYKAADTVTYAFLNDVSCEYIGWLSIEGNEELAYQAQQQAYEQAQNGENQEEGEMAEAAEVCQQLMQGIDLATCGGYEDDGNQDEDEDVQNEEDADYSWYTYLAAADAADDAQEMCLVVNALQGEFSGAHTYSDSDGEGGGSGHVYDYKGSRSSKGDLNAGKLFGIIIAVIVVIVAAVLVMQSMGGKKDSKKVPLVNNKNGGAMA